MSIELLAIFILCLALAVTLTAYDKRMRELKHLREIREDVEEKARRRAIEIINQAKDKSVDIISQVVEKVVDEKEELTSKLHGVTGQHISDYKHKLQSVSDSIINEVEEEVGQLKKALEVETLSTQRVVAEKYREKFSQLESQLNEYERQKQKEIDEKLADYLNKVVRKGILNGLTVDEQGKLITRALEEAKQTNAI